MITIVDTGGANINSVLFSLKRIDVSYRFATGPEDIMKAEKILLPGVGSAKNAMKRLEDHGVVKALQQTKANILGICLGMQLLFEKSEEGDVDCLGLLPGKVEKIKSTGLSLPHMGWNQLIVSGESPFDIFKGEYVYFVHSYRAQMNDTVLLYAEYGEKIPAIVGRGNYYGTQFHPEKSADVGERILKRFIEL